MLLFLVDTNAYPRMPLNDDFINLIYTSASTYKHILCSLGWHACVHEHVRRGVYVGHAA